MQRHWHSGGRSRHPLFVTLKDGKLDEDDIKAHCRTQMAKFMVPHIVTILDDMPRTPTGKPEKVSLRDILE